MSTLTAEADVAEPHDDHGHPPDSEYWKVGLFLAILTGLEVSTYWWPHSWHKFAAVTLIIMMTIKFGTVAAYFMHLKFDSPTLRRLFLMGLIGAVALYVAVLTSLTFWHDSGNAEFVDPPHAKPLPPTPTEPPPSIPAAGGH